MTERKSPLKNIRITDIDRLNEVEMDIVDLLDKAGLNPHEAIGLLEIIKLNIWDACDEDD